MIRYILPLLLCIPFYSQLYAQANGGGEVKGFISTEQHALLENASVSVNGTSYATKSLADGSFKLVLPNGAYRLSVAFSGCSSIAVDVDVKNGQVVDLGTLVLKDCAEELETAVITGQYAPQMLKKSVFQVRTLSHELIQQKAATNVMDALQSELGFRLTGVDGMTGETDIQLMGMSGQNVKILLDGVPLIDRGEKKQSLSQIDINTIDRIETVEGPMSVVYGSDALAGVINIITKKNAALAGSGKSKLTISARAQEETVGDEYRFLNGKGLHNDNLTVGYAHKSGMNASFGITRNDFGGWQGSYTGRAMEFKPKDQLMMSGSLGYKTDKLNVWYRLDFLNEAMYGYGDVTLSNTVVDKNYYVDRYTHLAEADWRLNSKWSFNASASYQDYSRKTQTILSNLTTGKRYLTADSTDQDSSYFKSGFVRATAQLKASNIFAFQGGLEYKYDSGSGERIDRERSISDYSVFISSEIKPFDRLNIRPGLRFSVNSIYDAPPAIPSVNIKYDLNDAMDVRASYAMGFRAPALRELYFEFVNANHNIHGNPDLKPEYSHSISGSYTWRVLANSELRYTTVVSLFYNLFKDRITLVLAEPLANRYEYANLEEYRTTGGMWENTLQWRNLRVSLGASYVGSYNKYSDDSTVPKDSLPNFVWSPEVNGNATYSFPKAGLNLSLFCKYTGIVPQYMENNSGNVVESRLQGFTWADFTARKTLLKHLTLNAGVKNIFNVTRLDISTGGSRSMSYGRSYFVGLSFNW